MVKHTPHLDKSPAQLREEIAAYEARILEVKLIMVDRHNPKDRSRLAGLTTARRARSNALESKTGHRW